MNGGFGEYEQNSAQRVRQRITNNATQHISPLLGPLPLQETNEGFVCVGATHTHAYTHTNTHTHTQHTHTYTHTYTHTPLAIAISNADM